MKRILVISIIITMMVSIWGGGAAGAQKNAEAEKINAFLMCSSYWNQPQEMKIFSVEELDNYISEYHYNKIPLYFDKNKYNEAFFEDKLLYFTLVTITGGSPKLEITSLSKMADTIEAEITIPRWPYTTPDAASWILVLEMDRTLTDMGVSISTIYQKIQNVDIIGDNITIELNGPKFDGEILLAAVYDAKGNLLSVGQNATDTEMRYVYNVNVDIKQTDAKTIKVMWWSGLNTIQPLCQAVTMVKAGENWTMAK